MEDSGLHAPGGGGSSCSPAAGDVQGAAGSAANTHNPDDADMSDAADAAPSPADGDAAASSQVQDLHGGTADASVMLAICNPGSAHLMPGMMKAGMQPLADQPVKPAAAAPHESQPAAPMPVAAAAKSTPPTPHLYPAKHSGAAPATSAPARTQPASDTFIARTPNRRGARPAAATPATSEGSAPKVRACCKSLQHVFPASLSV
jgi:hypothetical protein